MKTESVGFETASDMPSPEGLELWTSDDRKYRMGFAIRSSTPILELRQPAMIPIRIALDLEAVRLMLAGGTLILKGDGAACAMSRWGRRIEVRWLLDENLSMSLPVSTLVVAIAWCEIRIANAEPTAASKGKARRPNA